MLHVVMYPWIAYGHMIPYMHLANELAKRGHKITYILPSKAKSRLQPLNLYPNLINFRIINVPHVPPLPVGTETVTDIHDMFSLHDYLVVAFDQTRPEFESIMCELIQPDIVFYDFAYWVPQVARKLAMTIKFKAVCYCTASADAMNLSKRLGRSVLTCAMVDESNSEMSRTSSQDDSSSVQKNGADPLSGALSLLHRILALFKDSDAIALRSCRELEKEDCDEISNEYNKPVLLTGPLILETTKSVELESKWSNWLARFEPGSTLFCALGSQFTFDNKAQFQEILLGFEMTKMPFFLALRPPKGCASIQEAYPEGFEERVKDRGVVTDEWVQQPLILAHPSVGCFVNHCAIGTMWESLLSKNQIVLIPQLHDQKLNAKIVVNKLNVGVEVKREINGWISKENLCEAILCVMDEKSEICGFVKENHKILRDKLGAPGFKDDYVDNFIKDIHTLINDD